MTARPKYLIVRPIDPGVTVAMDALSEVLRCVRLTGGIFLDARFTAPWSVTAKIAPEDCKPFLAAPTQMIAYHVIIEGKLLLSLDGESPVGVRAGEIVILPRNDTHTLASAQGVAPVSADDLIQPSAEGGLARISYGGGGAGTHLVCGFLASDDARNPLVATLPRLMKLDVRDAASRDWIEASARFAASELIAGRVASSGIMSRLSELLFVEAVRSYASSLGEQEVGWLRGMSDPNVGRALALIHGAIDTPWTVDRLAREAALSRSTFVERFTSLIGMPPIRYLTYWRLQTAKLQLSETQQSIARIAHAVGYESEEAFSRAFKREFNLSPARWRKTGRAKP